MGRRRKSCVYDYFEYEELARTSKCLVEGCETKIKGRHGANLLRHFQYKHKQKFQTIRESNKENFPEPNKTDALNIKEIVTQNLINLVTIHGRPFALLEDEAFQNIINLIPMEDNTSVNAHKIRELVQERAYELRREIHSEIKDTLIALKVDVASVKTRRFLGINMQLIKDGVIVLRNLGVLELHQRNTALFLKDTILMVLSRYGINATQIYSITVDNGANMIKMIRDLEQELQIVFASELHEEEESVSYDLEHEEVTQRLLQGIEEIELDCNFPGEDQSQTFPKITAVRCAAHTLQLAVHDACKEVDQTLFERARKVSKILRNPNLSAELRMGKQPQAIIDCPTRWGSTADMLERVLILRDFCQNHVNVNLHLSESHWQDIADTLRVLKPCRTLTYLLQKEQLTFGDFFCSWIECLMQIDKIATPFSCMLAICMREREKQLLKNDCFLSAVYLDPRINSILSQEQIEKACHHLIIYQRLKKITNKTAASTSTSSDASLPGTSRTLIMSPVSPLDSSTESHNSQMETSRISELSSSPSALQDSQHPASSELDNFFRSTLSQNRSFLISCTDLDTMQLKYNLKMFLSHPLVPTKTNILNFWQNCKISNPQLYILTNVVLSTPPTQVSVERLFSSLKFVLSNLRMALTDDRIDDILLIRNNHLYSKD